MSLKKLISISLIVYGSMTSLLIVYGLFIAPPLKTSKINVGVPLVSSTNPDGTMSPSQVPDSSTETPGTPTTGGSTPAPSSSNQTPTSSATPTPAAQPKPTTSTPTPTPAPTPTPTPAPAPAPTPPPAPACGNAGGTCTAAQVASHNSASNCWMIYNGGYYIVTSYIPQHNGGTSVFNASTCGRDISGYMNGSQSTAGKNQRHSNSAYTILASYYVGKVSG